MAMIKIEKQSKTTVARKSVTVEVPEDAVVKKIGAYEVINTPNEGIKRIVNRSGGYLVTLDYGRVMKTNKKTGLKELKQDKTVKVTDTLAEAKKLRAEAEVIRKKRKEIGPEASLENHKATKITMQLAVDMYKSEGEFRELGEGYQKHVNNYLNHIVDYFKDFEPCKITRIDIENFYHYQLEHGNKDPNKRKKQPGVSVNTLTKYKTALIKVYDYMIISKKFNISENIALYTKIPKVTITVDGMEKKVSSIKHIGKSLTIEQLNITLNDLIQNEFDRSLLMMVALASIGGLRRGEIAALDLCKYYHNELMSVSDEIYEYSGYDKKYYEEHNNLFMVSASVERLSKGERRKLPKFDKIRVVGKPAVLDKIIEYCMEQRKEVNDIIGKEFERLDQMYMPLVNIIRKDTVHAEKISRKWEQYQKRRNKRLEKAGKEQLPIGDLQLLSNKKNEIIDALIQNLVEKMQKVNVINVASETNESLKAYFIKNIADNPDYFCSSYKKFDATKHLFVYEKEEDKITIQVPRAYKIDEILFDRNKLSFDEMLANIKINEDDNIELKNTWKDVYSSKGLTLSNAKPPKSVQFTPSKDDVRNKKTIAKPRKQVDLDILVLNKQSIEQSDEEKGQKS